MASTVPVTIDENLLDLRLKTNSKPLSEQLQKLNNVITGNARVLAQVADEMASLRQSTELQTLRLQRQIAALDDQQRKLDGDIVDQQQQTTQIASKCAWKSEIRDDQATLLARLRKVENYVEEMENGDGERLSRFVRTFVENYIPKWYETVAGPLWMRVTSAIQKSAEDLSRKVESRGIASDDRAKSLSAQVKTVMTELVSTLNDERKLDAMRIKMDAERAVEALRQWSEQMHQQLRAERAELQQRTKVSLSDLRMSVDALESTLLVSDATCRGFFAQTEAGDCRRGGEAVGTALSSANSGSDDDGGEERKPLVVRYATRAALDPPGHGRQPVNAKGPPRDANCVTAPPRGTLHRRGVTKRPPAVVRKRSPTAPSPVTVTSTAHSAVEPLSAAPPHPPEDDSSRRASVDTCQPPAGLSSSPPTPLLDADVLRTDLPAAQRDARVRFFLENPIFLVFRNALLRDLDSRFHVVSDDLQSKLAEVVFDMQKDLKSKVSLRKMQELLVEYRDQQLYNNVSSLLRNVDRLEGDKVASAFFDEVLRSKADVKSLDVKADQLYVEAQQSNLTARFERIETALGTIKEKLIQSDQRDKDLLNLVTDGQTEEQRRAGLFPKYPLSGLLGHHPLEPPKPVPQHLKVSDRREADDVAQSAAHRPNPARDLVLEEMKRLRMKVPAGALAASSDDALLDAIEVTGWSHHAAAPSSARKRSPPKSDCDPAAAASDPNLEEEDARRRTDIPLRSGDVDAGATAAQRRRNSAALTSNQQPRQSMAASGTQPAPLVNASVAAAPLLSPRVPVPTGSTGSLRASAVASHRPGTSGGGSGAFVALTTGQALYLEAVAGTASADNFLAQQQHAASASNPPSAAVPRIAAPANRGGGAPMSTPSSLALGRSHHPTTNGDPSFAHRPNAAHMPPPSASAPLAPHRPSPHGLDASGADAPIAPSATRSLATFDPDATTSLDMSLLRAAPQHGTTVLSGSTGIPISPRVTAVAAGLPPGKASRDVVRMPAIATGLMLVSPPAAPGTPLAPGTSSSRAADVASPVSASTSTTKSASLRLTTRARGQGYSHMSQ